MNFNHSHHPIQIRRLCSRVDSMRLLNPAVEIRSLNLLQGGFESHSRYHAHSTQLAEVVVSKATCSGFDSQSEHHAPVVQPAETTVLEAVRCEFESHLGHHMRESVNGKPIDSKSMTESSNLSSRAILLRELKRAKCAEEAPVN